MNGLTLAYIGDAIYELEVRKHLISQGHTKVNTLHNLAVKYTSSKAQASIIEYFMNENMLSEEEVNAFKWGRNNSSPGRKNVDGKTYLLATGFESLIGFLYSNNNKERLTNLIELAIEYIEKKD